MPLWHSMPSKLMREGLKKSTQQKAHARTKHCTFESKMHFFATVWKFSANAKTMAVLSIHMGSAMEYPQTKLSQACFQRQHAKNQHIHHICRISTQLSSLINNCS